MPFPGRDTLLHLRIPFSFYLLPVFAFGFSQSPAVSGFSTVLIFLSLHLFIYPASNLYNSYMDEDTGAIGGLEHPPPVTRSMYFVSIAVDVAGLLLALWASWQHCLVVAGYIAFSKSYSWRGIRLKKYPVLGWLSVMFFQGGYTYMMAGLATVGVVSAAWFTPQQLVGMAISSLLLGGSYPLTQIYQHEEDGERGDKTISLLLGVRGTFLFTGVFFGLGGALAFWYFMHYYSLFQFLVFAGCLSPVLIYFGWWAIQSWQNPAAANYKNAMRMNLVSAVCMVVCFGVIGWINLW